MTAPSECLKVAHHGGYTSIRITCPAVATENCEAIGTAILREVESLTQPELHLDLRDVTFITSLALSKLLSINGKVRDRGARLILRHLHTDIRKVFTVSRLDTVLEIDEGRELQIA
jgi:anti-anti-sigma factor